jgi:hypothetical protein
VTSASGLEVGYVALIVVYLGLGAAVLWLLRRLASTPPQSELTGGRAGQRGRPGPAGARRPRGRTAEA